MKELTIEQKAKAYDEAIKRGLDYIKHTPVTEMVTRQDIFEAIFPELKESEDEKIRKAIHIYLDWLDGRKDYAPKGKYTIKDMIAWIEKQGENHIVGNNEIVKSVWSEEDEEMLNLIIARLHSHPNVDLEEYSKEYDWLNYNLKSLRPQKQWKPTEEQLKSLKSVIDVGYFTSYPNSLETLYEQLKKLKGEIKL